MNLAALFRAARHLVGLSQKDLADLTELSLPTIKRVESDREVSVSPDVLAKVRRVLEDSGVIFLDGNGRGLKLAPRWEARLLKFEEQRASGRSTGRTAYVVDPDDLPRLPKGFNWAPDRSFDEQVEARGSTGFRRVALKARRDKLAIVGKIAQSPDKLP